ncbi:hypothetical protein Mp_1g24770 [Marchantia polymorpha subsp. ruderalis]|uniref:TPX2 C-terminal domain-containing protein n=2 Tax=Marchantia polymorpha TaxID=3197 RepID=A0AAF6ATZ2_MARPO|nr:hypothetical protein MARPO_0061s0044 [Marchantia polymorpha]BBM99912.1 hypothetical protein Mp_1g24770 [Marchantia polymorpha subsp. ruderalis]|eukprot:PTQ36772.1 hypothetical protein MARPO_0061s0044 [Marchantia polymorpha]
MEIPELNLSECESIFVRDDFYENIQAPKFHDFCSNEDPVSDVDAYFRRLGGKSPRQSADRFADQNASKPTKEPTVLKPPGLPKAPLSSMTLNSDATSSVPKASAAGLKKAKPAVPLLNPLTKSQDKASSKNKIYQRVSTLSNAPVSSSSSALDGKVSDPVLAPCAVKSFQASENTDPNGHSQPRRKVGNVGRSNSEESSVSTATEGSGSGSVRASIQTTSNSKDAIDRLALTKSQSQIPKPPKARSESTTRGVTDPAAVELPELKDRKRKPILRPAEAGALKVSDLKSRVSKQQRKSSTFSDGDSCSGVSDLGSSSHKVARIVCSDPPPPSSNTAAADKRATRRSSDNARRRRASGGLSQRHGRRALLSGPKSNLNPAPESSPKVEAHVSLSSPIQFGSNHTTKQLPSTEEQTVVTNVAVPKDSSTAEVSFVSGPIVPSTSWIDATEKRRSNDEVGVLSYSQILSRNGTSTRDSVEEAPCMAEETMGDVLLQKLQSLQLQAEDSPRAAEGQQQSSSATGGQDASMEAEAEACSGAHVNVPANAHAEVLPSDDLKVAGADSHLRKSPCLSEVRVVPHEADEELETSDGVEDLDVHTPVDASKADSCQDTRSAGDMVVEVDPDDVIESLQNLQLQHREVSSFHGFETSGCPPVTVGVARGESSLAVNNGLDNTLCISAEDSEPCLQDIHAGIHPTEQNVASSCSQGKKTEEAFRSLKRVLSKGPSRESHDSEPGLSNSKGGHFFMDNQQKRSNKRKSIELGPHRTEHKLATASTAVHADEQRKAKVSSQSSIAPIAPISHSQLSTSASRVAASSSISAQHKKMKTTCPQPFRLRTEERGALKEVEFNKKIELYLSAKEKMQNATFQFTTSKDVRSTVKPPRVPCKDTKTSVKQVQQHTQARAAERALFNMQVTEKSIRTDEERQEKEKRMQDADEEIKRMRKQMVPHAQKMPFFDRPFKPHRSTKTLTVPSSPKFHLKAKKTCARTGTQE